MITLRRAIVGVVAAVVGLGVMSGCSSAELPTSCDALDAEAVEEYVGEPVYPRNLTVTEDFVWCGFDFASRSGSSVRLSAYASGHPVDAYEPNTAAQTQTRCGQDKLHVYTCHAGTVGGDSWCEVNDGYDDELAVEVSWDHDGLAMHLAAYVTPEDAARLSILNCHQIEALAEKVDAAL